MNPTKSQIESALRWYEHKDSDSDRALLAEYARMHHWRPMAEAGFTLVMTHAYIQTQKANDSDERTRNA
jgi:hypothetical protein